MQKSSGPLGSLDPHKTINIIGAGFSGLIMAYYLKQQGLKVKIYEKSETPGGKLGTNSTQLGLVESAANALYADDSVYELLSELELEYLEPKQKLKKVIWRNSKFSSPVKFLEVLTSLPKLLKKPNIHETTTIKEFFSPLLGEVLSTEVLAAGFVGVYGVDIDELHFKSLFEDRDYKSYLDFFKFQKQKNKNQKQKRQSLSFKMGMQELVQALQKKLDNELILNVKEEELPTDNLLICTNAHCAGELIKEDMPELHSILSEIEYTPLTSVTVFSQDEIKALKGCFGGVIAPKTPDISTVGILANSEIFEHRVCNPDWHSYTFIMQGKKNIDDLDQDLKMLKIDQRFSTDQVCFFKFWPKALPIYNINRYESILKMRSLLLQSQKKVCLFGNYTDGIALRNLISQAKEFSRKISS